MGWFRKYFGYKDLNPLWVVDMDFKTPKFINDAIIEIKISLWL